MQFALTRKLADAMKIKPPSEHEVRDPLYCWTVNWAKVWSNSRTGDMLVLVNHATSFTVAIYEIKRKDLRNVAEMMRAAISNTLLSLGLNPDIVAEYMRQAGESEFVLNHSRQTAAWVTRAGNDCAFHIAREYDGIDKVFNDTVGALINHHLVSCPGNSREMCYPRDEMFNALARLTDRQLYRYRALELLVTLDLEVYRAARRLIVPADMRLSRLHRLLQSVFGWKNCHLHDFVIHDRDGRRIVRLVPYGDDLEYDRDAVLVGRHTLSEVFPKYRNMLYTYDMGDDWVHVIQLVRVIEDYDKESPYLLEASGQTPPEDVGGVGGFLSFRRIMLDPKHPDHAEMRAWAGYWTVDLSEFMRTPRVIHA